MHPSSRFEHFESVVRCTAGNSLDDGLRVETRKSGDYISCRKLGYWHVVSGGSGVKKDVRSNYDD